MTIIPNTCPIEVIIQRKKAHEAAIKLFRTEIKVLKGKLFVADDNLKWHEKALINEQRKIREIGKQKHIHNMKKEY